MVVGIGFDNYLDLENGKRKIDKNDIDILEIKIGVKMKEEEIVG